LLTVLLTALIAGLAAGGLALAGKPAKPGGGGGGGTVPPGTIYFVQGDETFTARTMKADGSGKADSVRGEPTYQLHEGARWFLTGIVSDADPFGQELFAVADDGTEVPLGVNSHEAYSARWAKDDSFLSYEAFIDTPDGLTAALFVAEVDWSFGFPLIGEPLKVLDTNVVEPYLVAFDWSPSGDEAVYMLVDYLEDSGPVYSLEVVRFFADGTTATRALVSEFSVNPEWSPDGSRIAFQGTSDAIWTIRPDGTDALKVSNNGPQSLTPHRDPHWSPDSQYLIFTQSTRNRLQKGDLFITYSKDIVRISATGGGQTELTRDTDEKCYGIAWR
jgi:hypothetical protein